MVALKHVGQVKNTAARCIVIFREIYNEKGHVIEPDDCLVVETDGLPDAEHSDIMRIIEGNAAQSTGEVYNVFMRERLSNGYTALDWLHKSGRLNKYKTNNIVMTPDRNQSLDLDKLNTIIRMQNKGASESSINKAISEDANTDTMVSNSDDNDRTAPLDKVMHSDVPTATTVAEPGLNALTDNDIADSYINSALLLEKEAQEYREKAVKLNPKLKAPVKKATTSRKRKPAATKK